MTLTDIYNQNVKPLSPADRLRLAKLILEDIPAEWVVDYSDEWTEEDYEDFSRNTWQQADSALKP